MGSPDWGARERAAVALRLRAVTKRFGDSVALDGVDITVPGGARLLLVGPNGAGKTTLMGLVLGLLRPTSGSVEVLGLEPRIRGAEVRAQIGCVSEWPDVPYGWMSVDEVIRHHASYRPGWIQAYARELGEALEIDLRRPFGKLSKGQVRRVELLTALAHAPRLLVLDEPTDGLDPLMRERVIQLLRAHVQRFATTLMISTHIIHDADRLADRVAVVARGRVLLQGHRRDLLPHEADGQTLEQAILAVLTDPQSQTHLRRGEAP